jgi:hypothetical protein
MQEKTAKELMDTLSALDEPLNKAAELIEQINDEEERKKFRKSLGNIMAGIYTDLELLITQQYPDLNPDKR